MNNSMQGNNKNNEDALLQMFFDPDFVPHVYLDILLSPAQSQNSTKNTPSVEKLKELQPLANNLLSKFDYYAETLTSELGTCVKQLEEPIEEIYVSGSKKTKLEFYIDTLSNSLSSLENDLNKMGNQIAILNKAYGTNNSNDDAIHEQIRLKIIKLNTIKKRVTTVHKCFQKLNDIIQAENKQSVSISEFKSSLLELQDNLVTSLRDKTTVSGSVAVDENKEFIEEIKFLIDLKTVFKNVDKFYPIYSDFAKTLKNELNNSKSVLNEN
ncbi:uncharacterized protein SCODWIG_03270 [Saccharomycodes ludwigii]|uniref:Uncharacterized protein n=1 Tax=Saccharomycodes ludwigii TaxID=36035 RepID=A0A376BAA5_9ASCO|nr:hypothetical protein SCDLUD_001504 [Saccharomycodes ludwigii]KAH3901731.1 hypothetical protein SCDLUD_001504 [Saccharomycodes ludwigii]SSD61509.1 uncharacterized protein SCODWIG_03270 [Saccharomycodes ludwigii]